MHFAGQVIYDATEFVEKNRDEVPTALHDLVLSSNDRWVPFLSKGNIAPIGLK